MYVLTETTLKFKVNTAYSVMLMQMMPYIQRAQSFSYGFKGSILQ
jgi:hypothetical protein